MGRKVQEANIRPSRTGKDMKREHARNNYNKAVFDTWRKSRLQNVVCG